MLTILWNFLEIYITDLTPAVGNSTLYMDKYFFFDITYNMLWFIERRLLQYAPGISFMGKNAYCVTLITVIN